jgi:hypothetical protein
MGRQLAGRLDRYGSATSDSSDGDPDHREASMEIVAQAMATSTAARTGWYCTGDNEFKTDQQIVDGRCPDHPTLELQWLEEENWFFALSKYQEPLEELYRSNPEFCEPEHFRNEVLGWLSEGLQDFSVSRPGGLGSLPRRRRPPDLRLGRCPHQPCHRAGFWEIFLQKWWRPIHVIAEHHPLHCQTGQLCYECRPPPAAPCLAHLC